MSRVVYRYASSVRVVVDVPETLAARKRFPLFTDMVVGRFDQPLSLYRIFDQQELGHILTTGKITGGSFSVAAERAFGASWGHNLSEVIRWGLGQAGKCILKACNPRLKFWQMERG